MVTGAICRYTPTKWLRF